jgi:hypothetical protein
MVDLLCYLDRIVHWVVKDKYRLSIAEVRRLGILWGAVGI